MAKTDFFPVRPESRPTIYACQDCNPQYDGQLEVGYTTRTAREQLPQQFHEVRCKGRRIEVQRDLR